MNRHTEHPTRLTPLRPVSRHLLPLAHAALLDLRHYAAVQATSSLPPPALKPPIRHSQASNKVDSPSSREQQHGCNFTKIVESLLKNRKSVKTHRVTIDSDAASEQGQPSAAGTYSRLVTLASLPSDAPVSQCADSTPAPLTVHAQEPRSPVCSPVAAFR